MTKLQELANKRDALTITLKRMSGLESNYGQIWDQRVDVIRQINELEESI